MTFARVISLFLLSLTLLLLDLSKVNSFYFGGCHERHCVRCSEYATCLECAYGYTFEDGDSGKCISVESYEAEQDFKGLEAKGAAFIKILFVAIFCVIGIAICFKIGQLAAKDESDEGATNPLRSSTGSGMNSGHPGTTPRLGPTFDPSVPRDTGPSPQTAPDYTHPLLPTEVHASHTFPIVVADPDGSFQVATKN